MNRRFFEQLVSVKFFVNTELCHLIEKIFSSYANVVKQLTTKYYEWLMVLAFQHMMPTVIYPLVFAWSISTLVTQVRAETDTYPVVMDPGG